MCRLTVPVRAYQVVTDSATAAWVPGALVHVHAGSEACGHLESLEAAAEGGAVLHEALRVRKAGGAVARV